MKKIRQRRRSKRTYYKEGLCRLILGKPYSHLQSVSHWEILYQDPDFYNKVADCYNVTWTDPLSYLQVSSVSTPAISSNIIFLLGTSPIKTFSLSCNISDKHLSILNRWAQNFPWPFLTENVTAHRRKTVNAILPKSNHSSLKSFLLFFDNADMKELNKEPSTRSQHIDIRFL